MSLVVPKISRQTMLRLLTNNQAPENWVIHLFVNNITPGLNDTVGSYTEAAGGGYTSFTLAGASWAFSNDGSDNGLATFANQVWTFTGALTGAATVYGYYVTRLTTGDLLFAENKFGIAPILGTVLTLSPLFTLNDV